ncbi:unnamed protein product [Alopecurus aequalis]
MQNSLRQFRFRCDSEVRTAAASAMAATAKDAHVPEEVTSWWDTVRNGVTVDEGEEEEEEPEVEVDSDSDFERVAAEEENAGVVASEIDGNVAADSHARVEEQSSGGATAARHGDEEEVSGDCYIQIRGGLLGRKRKAIDNPRTTGTEIQDEKYHGEHISEDNYVQAGGELQTRKTEATVPPRKLQTTTEQDKSAQGECLRAENEMLSLQLMHKINELQDEQIRALKLELDLKNKEIESVEKQNRDYRAENEHYRKTAKPPRNKRLCGFCNEYVLGHDYRNCPERRASASSVQDEEDDSE